LHDHHVEIRVWMMRKGLRPIMVARDLDVNPGTVTRWLEGHFRSKRFSDYFRDRGCPEAFLSGLRAA